MEGSGASGFFSIAVILTIYFLPTIISSSRGHQNAGAIFTLNLLLGWTLLGWVVAAVWSLTAVPAPDHSGHAAGLKNALDGRARGETRSCPYCAEQILRAAILCKHCGQVIEPAVD